MEKHLATRCIIQSSFVKGARSSQCDWYLKFDNFVIFGDGHGEWSESHIEDFKLDFLNAIGEAKSAQLESASPEQYLQYIYRCAVFGWLCKHKFTDCGTTLNIVMQTADKCIGIQQGDSPVIVRLPEQIWSCPGFEWNSQAGHLIGEAFRKQMPCCSHVTYPRRYDAVPWENRCIPKFHFGLHHSGTFCAPETIGMLGGGELGLPTHSENVKFQMQLVAAGLFEDCIPEPILLFQGDPTDLQIYLTSDGGFSKGALGLADFANNYVTLCEVDAAISIGALIASSSTSFFHQIFDSTPQMCRGYNVASFMASPLGDLPEIAEPVPCTAKYFLYSKSHMLQILSQESGFDVFTDFMKEWRSTGVLDILWWQAIERELDFFSRFKTVAEIPVCRIEIINRLAVLLLSDDNISSLSLTFEQN